MQELVLRINDLEANLNEVSARVYELSKLSASYGDAWISAVTGFVGVVVGAYISYHFSRKLSNEDRKARTVIQRKNLFYSKLYKEIQELLNIFEKIPPNRFYIRISFGEPVRHFFSSGSETLETPRLSVWADMKRDIRVLYIPDTVKSLLDEVYSRAKSYNDTIAEMHGEVEKLKQTPSNFELSEMLYVVTNRRLNVDSSLLFDRNADPDQATAKLMSDPKLKALEEPSKSEIGNTYRSFITDVLALNSRQQASNLYTDLQYSSKEAQEKLSNIITTITNKYEYGTEII